MITCEVCGRSIAARADGRPRAHKPRKGALDNCKGGGRGAPEIWANIGPEIGGSGLS